MGNNLETVFQQWRCCGCYGSLLCSLKLWLFQFDQTELGECFSDTPKLWHAAEVAYMSCVARFWLHGTQRDEAASCISSLLTRQPALWCFRNCYVQHLALCTKLVLGCGGMGWCMCVLQRFDVGGSPTDRRKEGLSFARMAHLLQFMAVLHAWLIF